MLRLDWNLLFTMINLLILFWVLKKFLFRPVLEIIEKRQQLIEEQLTKAKQVGAEAEQLKEEYVMSISKAKKTRERMIEEAQKEANEKYEEIIEEANVKATRIISQAREEIEIERNHVMKSMESQVGVLAILAAKKIVSMGE